MPTPSIKETISAHDEGEDLRHEVDSARQAAYRHTPGPWTVDETGSPDIYNGVYHNFFVTAAGGGGAIAQVFPCGNPRKAFNNPELSDMPEPSNGRIRKANARLLSYAPLLLEGAIMARSILALDERINSHAIKALDELIAGATGARP